MTTEELLKPRYKVIADYPNNEFNIGDVIQFDCEGELPMQMAEEPITSWLTDFIKKKDGSSTMYSDVFFKPFPHLFKPLQWWEEREEKDMPEYVKAVAPHLECNGECYKVFGWLYFEDGTLTHCQHGKDKWDSIHINWVMPATLEEYNQYNQQGTKINR